ncbi:hypothetical protein GCM10020369_08610 [Cryptosporangium minutisporangium]|uniref:Uncharacterized protein n=1 Tax=Cryptosporangium minutisporangium TaxID=113569 RepID=A0ABP6SSB0_9ACTN
MPLGLLKMVLGLAMTAAAIAGGFVIHAAGGGIPAMLLWALPGLYLVDWGAPMIADGATDLWTRYGWRELRSGRALELRPDGVRYTAALPLDAGADVPPPDVVAGWDQVSAAAFRPGAAQSWWFCLDLADGVWPAERTHALVATYRAGGGDSRPSRATADRRLGETLDWFGTPLAVNTLICPGGHVRRIDRALRKWTGGRLRCRAAEPPWWRPPHVPGGWKTR